MKTITNGDRILQTIAWNGFCVPFWSSPIPIQTLYAHYVILPTRDSAISVEKRMCAVRLGLTSVWPLCGFEASAHVSGPCRVGTSQQRALPFTRVSKSDLSAYQLHGNSSFEFASS